MMRVLEGVRHRDVTMFEKFAVMMQVKGYENGDVQAIKEIVEIIRLRGLYDKPDRWFDTLTLIYTSWVAFNGVVSPLDVVTFLRSAGPDAAKGLSDKGLETMIIYIKRQYQSGDSPAAPARSSAIRCDAPGVAQMVIPDMFAKNPSAKKLGLVVGSVAVVDVDDGGVCTVSVKTNHRHTFKYRFQFGPDGVAALDMIQ
jgi:hypothetical protein